MLIVPSHSYIHLDNIIEHLKTIANVKIKCQKRFLAILTRLGPLTGIFRPQYDHQHRFRDISPALRAFSLFV